jgi:hypothetical protein
MKRHVDAAVVCRAVGMDDVVVACRQAGVQSSRELVEHEAMFHVEHAHRALGPDRRQARCRWLAQGPRLTSPSVSSHPGI